jgi:WhiB family redox-sensing transcriptional regulator
MAWLMAPGEGEPLTFLAELIRRPEWQGHGACRGETIETFVPSLGGSFNRARELCGQCAVSRECLGFALADEDVVGMWAGTTAAERRAMRQRRRVA